MSLRTPDFVVGPFRQRDSITLTGVVRDDTGAPIPGASLFSMVFTLYNEADPFDIINSRDAVNVLPNVDTDGVLTLDLDGEDMEIQDEDELTEKHRALLAWTWNAGARRASCEVQIIVRNVLKVGT